ncbi:MAG: winged helix-turn-helix domain-containing protein, partial [Saprospiraceae bacterium]|nr:winged helix-turn-helix domain-containing protein [Pyrinomonadaceae bacterium]
METAENKRFVYEFGKFVLDPQEKTLFSDGLPLHLPAKEFETLLVLIENNRRALTKDEMISAVWPDAFVEEGNLAKQISRLRKIFNTNGDQYIETLPKRGYRFSADLRRTRPVIEEPVILEKRTVKRLTIAVENEVDDRPLALPPRRNRIPGFKMLAPFGLIVLLGAGVWYFNRPTLQPTSKINSIAVLPLKSLTAEENGKALGMGLTDALITKLGSLKQIVVRPTSAVTTFAESPADPVEIGKKLNVDAVLEGTIQQSEGRLRINARLIRTDTGMQIWTERFDEPAGGIFALQDALSARIAKTLAFELSSNDNTRLAHRGTDNADSYEKYLRGRFHQSQNTPDGLNRSIEFYEQAIALDPNFAEAHAGIADANVILFNFGLLPPTDTVPRARQEINRALELNPDLSNVHTSLALIQFLIDRNWPDAERSLQRAIELNGNNADAYLRYRYFLTIAGRLQEGLEKLTKARELNPLSPMAHANIGLAHLLAKRYTEAIDVLEKTAAENPEFTLAQWFLGTAYEAIGDHEKSFSARVKALELEGGGEFSAQLQKIQASRGIDAANRFWLEESIKAKTTGEIRSTGQKQTGGLPAMTIALRAATVKDREQTLSWLEKTLEEGDTKLVQVKYLQKFDFVR